MNKIINQVKIPVVAEVPAKAKKIRKKLKNKMYNPQNLGVLILYKDRLNRTQN